MVAVITDLSERRIDFHGNNELLGSPHNGNYLGTDLGMILELIAQLDPS